MTRAQRRVIAAEKLGAARVCVLVAPRAWLCRLECGHTVRVRKRRPPYDRPRKVVCPACEVPPASATAADLMRFRGALIRALAVMAERRALGGWRPPPVIFHLPRPDRLQETR